MERSRGKRSRKSKKPSSAPAPAERPSSAKEAAAKKSEKQPEPGAEYIAFASMLTSLGSPKATPYQNWPPEKPEPIIPLECPYDWIEFPKGALDLQRAGIAFKNPDAPANKERIKQYTALLNAGYKLKQFIPDANSIYMVFEKK